MLERVAARLGTDRVLRPVLTEGHRLECMPTWQPVPLLAPRKTA
jgi:protein ImuB